MKKLIDKIIKRKLTESKKIIEVIDLKVKVEQIDNESKTLHK